MADGFITRKAGKSNELTAVSQNIPGGWSVTIPTTRKATACYGIYRGETSANQKTISFIANSLIRQCQYLNSTNISIKTLSSVSFNSNNISITVADQFGYGGWDIYYY